MKSGHCNFERLAQTVETLIDERVGIIRYVKEARSQSGTPSFFHYYAKTCNTSAFAIHRNFDETGGASSIRPVAAAKAIGEAIERYCAAIYVKEELPFESFDSATFKCVEPEEFALYSPAQYKQTHFPYVPFSRATRIHWARGREPQSGQSWYVPAAMVYMPYSYESEKGEFPFAQPISTGLACHITRTEAMLSGLCEVIERDAFAITWQAMIPAPPIRLESLSEDNRDLVQRFESAGGEVRLLNITMDHGVPAVLAILMSSSDNCPAFVFAASAHPSPEIAIQKSLEELAHTRRLAVQLKISDQPLSRKQDFHVKLYTDKKSHSATVFLLSSKRWIDFQELSDLSTGNPDHDLAVVANCIANVGCKPLVVDLTTPDVGELGFYVIRAIVPKFHPLCMDHALRALGGVRLWSVPQKLGYEGITPGRGDNPAPHPFP